MKPKGMAKTEAIRSLTRKTAKEMSRTKYGIMSQRGKSRRYNVLIESIANIMKRSEAPHIHRSMEEEKIAMSMTFGE
jgi:ribosomal protein L20A (L18A)